MFPGRGNFRLDPWVPVVNGLAVEREKGILQRVLNLYGQKLWKHRYILFVKAKLPGFRSSFFGSKKLKDGNFKASGAGSLWNLTSIFFLVSAVSSGLKHVDEKTVDVFWYHNYETQEWDEQFDIHLFLMNEKSNGMACNSGEVREWRFGTWIG